MERTSVHGRTITETLPKLYPVHAVPLRKHAYSNILKILQPKKETFQIKKI